MSIFQKQIQLPPFARGCHLITREIVAAIPELRTIQVGLLSVFLQHTSASLTINENADPAVIQDLDAMLDRWVPEDFPYRHQEEGADDMPAHGKATLTGASLTIPVSQGVLALGIWQGIYLCEHRKHGGRRNLVLTLVGE